jgi:hypothetical protein
LTSIRRMLFFAAALGLIAPFKCWAQMEPSMTSSTFLGTVPLQPVAGQSFVVNVESGECENLSADRSAVQIQSIVGTVVTVAVLANLDSACNSPPVTRQYDVPPIAAPGVYRIRLYFARTFDTPLLGFMGGRDVAVVAGAVASPSAAIVPTLSGGFQLALSLLVLLFATETMLRKR